MTQVTKSILRAGLLVFMTTASLSGPYLAEVGPVPIRFQRLAVPKNAAEVLPPLQMNDDPPASASTTNIVESAEMIGPVPPADFTAPAANPIDLTQEPAPAPDSGQAPAVTPQMLLRYFTPGGNREAIVQAPVEFTPPTPGKSSSAVYVSE